MRFNVYCSQHPRYKGKSAPTSLCHACLQLQHAVHERKGIVIVREDGSKLVIRLFES